MLDKKMDLLSVFCDGKTKVGSWNVSLRSCTVGTGKIEAIFYFYFFWFPPNFVDRL